MKKKISTSLICALIALASFLSISVISHADDYPQQVTLSKYHNGTVQKNGETFLESDWENSDGCPTLTVLLKSTGNEAPIIHSGDAVIANFGDGTEYKLTVDSAYSCENGLLVRIPTLDIFVPEDGLNYNIHLSFYDDSGMLRYSGRGSGFTGENMPAAPQTGDGAVAWCLAGFVCVAAMAFMLAPKRKTGM